MPVYEYKARDQKDQVVTGTMEADTEAGLVDKLRKMNYVVTKIGEIKPKKVASVGPGRGTEKIKQKDMLKFIVKLSSMLQVGISLPAGIRILRDQTKKPKFKSVLNGLYANISSGVSFSKSLSFYPNAFPDIMVKMVRVGETTGKLSDILAHYAEYSENQANIRSQIKSALTYPLAVITVSGIILYIFLVFVIPKFIDMFKEANIELPLPTQILFNLSNFARDCWLYVLTALIILFICYKLAKRRYSFNRFIDNIKLKIPGFSVLLKKMIQARFAQTLGLLYQSGVPILESIKTSEGILGNIQYSQAMKELHAHVKDGKKISDYIAGNRLFSADIVEMVSVGESTGRLSDMLQRSALFYRKEINVAVKSFLTLLEPIIICGMGVFIAFLALSVIMPIFKMMSEIGAG